MEIQEHALSFLRDPLHGRVELRPTVTPQGMKHVAGEALRVDPHEDTFTAADITLHQRDVGFAVDAGLIRKDLKRSVYGRQRGARDTRHHTLGAHAIPDQLRDGDHRQLVFFRKLRQLRHPRHRAVVIHDFADDTGGRQACDAGEVHGGFGVAGPHEYTTRTCAQGEDVTRA